MDTHYFGTLAVTRAFAPQLAAQGTQVAALHVGYMDTDMTATITDPKSDPAEIAAIALDALEGGEVEILGDEISRQVQARLAGGVAALYPQFAPQPATAH